MTGLNISIIACCVILQGFFSGSEMVILATNKIRLTREVAKGSKGAKLALKIINNQRWALATTTTGTNMFVIISSVVTSIWFEHLFGRTYGEVMTILILSPVLLMFGEIIPRTVFQQRATQLAPKIAYILWIASKVISPLTGLVYLISKLFYRRVGTQDISKLPSITKDELSMVLNVPGEGSDMHKKEKFLIRKVFQLANSLVNDMMVPLVNVTALQDTSTVADAIKIISRTGFSRLPIYKDRIDNLVGVIYALDLIDLKDRTLSIEQFVREVPFVPELKQASDLLKEFQKDHNSIAIVLDEYGGGVGIITFEDILEEVVGEIRDEYDSEVRQYIELGPHKYQVKAGLEIEQANEMLGLLLPKEDYETLAGFLLKQMGKIPKKGDIYIYNNIKFVIISSSKRLIREVVIEIFEPEPEAPESSVTSNFSPGE
ncbi:MAG: hemolysin family protein [Desulfobacterales bacterium]|nr:hemolysin family protein [Desulfobacterales bacterium]